MSSTKRFELATEPEIEIGCEVVADKLEMAVKIEVETGSLVADMVVEMIVDLVVVVVEALAATSSNHHIETAKVVDMPDIVEVVRTMAAVVDTMKKMASVNWPNIEE